MDFIPNAGHSAQSSTVTNAEFINKLFPELETGEYLWTTSFKENPNTATAEWAGNKVTNPQDIKDTTNRNAYFSVAVLKAAQGSASRRKENFCRLPVVVADDAVGDIDCTWKLQTSEGKFQIGWRLDKPITDLTIAENLHKQLKEMDLIPADKSGNNAVRYVRLPNQVNTKYTPQFKSQLVEFDPERVFSLHELCVLLGLPYDRIVNGSSERTENLYNATKDFGEGRISDEEYLRRITSGESIHDSVLVLTSRMLVNGMPPEMVSAYMHSLLEAHDDGSARWSARIAEIDRSIKGAVEKYGFDAQLSGVKVELDAAEESEDLPFPEPFRGVMAATVEATLKGSQKPQKSLSTMVTLIGMASACSGSRYMLPPSAMRLNLYGVGLAKSGAGKDVPRRMLIDIARASGVTLLPPPVSNGGLEDSLVALPMLLELDEVGFMFQTMNSRNASSYESMLAAVLLRLYTSGNGTYVTRGKARTRGITESREITNPTLNLYGTTTPEKLGQALSMSSVEDGMIGRFLFCQGDDAVLPQRHCEALVVPQELIDKAEIIKGGVDFDQPLIEVIKPKELDDHLYDLRLGYETQANNSKTSISRILLIRSYEKLERIAGVLAVWDAPTAPVITMEHVQWAKAFVDASNAALLRFVLDHMHEGKVQADAAVVIKTIKRCLSGDLHPSRSSDTKHIENGLVSRSMVMRHTRLDKRAMDDATGYLEDIQTLVVVNIEDPTQRGALRNAPIWGSQNDRTCSHVCTAFIPPPVFTVFCECVKPALVRLISIYIYLFTHIYLYIKKYTGLPLRMGVYIRSCCEHKQKTLETQYQTDVPHSQIAVKTHEHA